MKIIHVSDIHRLTTFSVAGLVICATCIFLFFLIGCSDGTKLDQTGETTIVARVESELVYQIKIQKRIDEYLAYRRSEETVFFNPTPDEMLKLEYVYLKRAIRETGMAIPGNAIETGEVVSFARDLAISKAREIVARLKSGSSFADVVAEFKLDKPQREVRMIKGSNPGYDDAIWSTEIGEIAEPVVHYDRILVFRVLDRGVDDKDGEWAQIEQIDFLFPRDEARRQMETQKSKNWDIRITNLYYSALNNYFKSELDNASTELQKYLKGKGLRKDLAYYLMFRILESKQKSNPDDDSIVLSMKENLQKAIQNCTDVKMIPNFQFEFGNCLYTAGNLDGAREQYREALDNVKMDINLVERLVLAFTAIKDDEYTAIAKEKFQSLSELKESEGAKQSVKQSFKTEEDDEIAGN